jgi:hypothetical protein
MYLSLPPILPRINYNLLYRYFILSAHIKKVLAIKKGRKKTCRQKHKEEKNRRQQGMIGIMNEKF